MNCVYKWAATYLEISEGHKLDDISGGDITCGRTQQFVVTVKELHGVKVCPTHTHYDDRHGQPRGRHNRGTGLVHVCDDSVCDDEQHVVVLEMETEKITY